MHLETHDVKKLKWRKVGDGLEVMSIPLMVMDGAPRAMAEATNSAVAEATNVVDTTSNHRPHFAAQSDEDRERRQTLYADAQTKLCDRWKNPPSLAADVAMSAEAKPTGDAKQDAYQAYDQRTSNAWRTPVG